MTRPDEFMRDLFATVKGGGSAVDQRSRRSSAIGTANPSDRTHIQDWWNPMTGLGDIVYGGEDGQPRRLPIGPEGWVLTVVDIGGGVLVPRWQAP